MKNVDYRKKLAREIEEILKKQKGISINENLVRICRELNEFTEKLNNCIKNNKDLSEKDKAKIQELNNDYNKNFEEFKKLQGM